MYKIDVSATGTIQMECKWLQKTRKSYIRKRQIKQIILQTTEGNLANYNYGLIILICKCMNKQAHYT